MSSTPTPATRTRSSRTSQSRISSMNMEERIFEVVIPMEDVMEFKNGQKVVVAAEGLPRLPAGPHVPGRRLLVRGPQHARRDRFRRLRGQADPAVREGSGQDPRRPAGREAEASGRVAGRRVGHASPPARSPSCPARSPRSTPTSRSSRSWSRSSAGRPRSSSRSTRSRSSDHSEGVTALMPPRSRSPSPRGGGAEDPAPGRPGHPGAAGGNGPRPARRQHHGLLQGVQRGAPRTSAATVVPVEITIYEDRMRSASSPKTPPAPVLLRQGRRGREGLGRARTVRRSAPSPGPRCGEIAETKMPDLNAIDVEGAMKIVEGTARSMGITVAS